LNKFRITYLSNNLLLDFEKSFWVFQRVEIAKSLWLIKVCGIGFCLYWFQIIFYNKCNPCTLWNKFSFLCLLRLAVFLRGSRSTILVLVCWPRRVCVLRCSRSLFWLWCKWSSCDCLVDFLRGFLRRLDVALDLEWTSINICVHFLYP